MFKMSRRKTTSSPTSAVPSSATARVWVLPAKQARSQQTRDRLLEAGRALLEEGFFDETSIAQIARRAGCSVGAFYFRFPDKQAYFDHLLSSVLGDAFESALRAVSDETIRTLSAVGTVGHCIDHYFRLIRDHQGILRSVQKRTMQESGTWRPVRDAGQKLVAHYTQAIACKYGEIENPTFRANARAAFQIVSSVLMNSAINRPPILGLDDPKLQFWLNEVVVHCLFVRPQAQDVPGQAHNSPDATADGVTRLKRAAPAA